jgi:hypothetical protein
MEKLRGRRPAPSLVISIIALVVAMTGSAGAALKLYIRDSSQIRSQAITSSDIRNHTIRGLDVADGTITPSKLVGGLRTSIGGQPTTAQEVVRKAGPESQPAGAHTVATLPQLAPGTYVLLAKTTLTSAAADQGLLTEALKTTKTLAGHCVLSAAGDQDDARAPLATPYSVTPSTMNMQMTRSIDAPSDIAVVCDSDYAWRASDTSIVALKLEGSTRTDVAG